MAKRPSAFSRFTQKFGESIGSAEKTPIDQELEKGCNRMAETKDQMSKVLDKLNDLLQPDPAIRLKSSLGKDNIKTKHDNLSDVLGAATSKLRADSEPFVAALNSFGEVEHHMGGLERQYLFQVEDDFLKEIRTFVTEDFKHMEAERKKLNQRRIDLDVTKNKLKKATNPELKNALERTLGQQVTDFESQSEALRGILVNFESKKEVMRNAIRQYFVVQKDYYAKCVEMMEEATNSIT